MKLENMGNRTASVLPLPVGAMRRTFSPAKIGGKAIVCGRVGSENPNSAKASRTGLARNSKTLEADAVLFISRLPKTIGTLQGLSFTSAYWKREFQPRVLMVSYRNSFSKVAFSEDISELGNQRLFSATANQLIVFIGPDRQASSFSFVHKMQKSLIFLKLKKGNRT